MNYSATEITNLFWWMMFDLRPDPLLLRLLASPKHRHDGTVLLLTKPALPGTQAGVLPSQYLRYVTQFASLLGFEERTESCVAAVFSQLRIAVTLW